MATMTGDERLRNPFRFSSKYTDDETDLVYYGYRYYSPAMGRWMSRDPIGERGGGNLSLFVGNDAIGGTDLLGLRGCDRSKEPCCCCCVEQIWTERKLLYEVPRKARWPSKRMLPGRYKYDIKVGAELVYKLLSEEEEDPANLACSLRWTERNMADSTGRMKTPGGYLPPGGSATFSTWEGWEHCPECPGTVDLRMPSPHGWGVLPFAAVGTSHLVSDVTIYSGKAPACRSVCTYSWMRVRIETKLKVTGGKRVKSFESISIKFSSG